jgi:hypothetical protein
MARSKAQDSHLLILIILTMLRLARHLPKFIYHAAVPNNIQMAVETVCPNRIENKENNFLFYPVSSLHIPIFSISADTNNVSSVSIPCS